MYPIEIRPLAKEDYRALYTVIEKNRERLTMYFPKTSASIINLQTAKTYTLLKAKQALQKEQYFFSVWLKGTAEMVGGIILKNLDWTIPKGELAYFVSEPYEGKGITTAAVKWLVAYAFEQLEMEKLYIKFNPLNEASKRVAIKNNFEKEGFLKSEFRTGYGVLTDVERYGLLRNNIK